ncbi:MAG: hypothetical protein FWC56_04165, partial [Phycisphaerae bacterium]|nr:hypothetical protein [Phycisphaerae bacterium]
MKTAPSSRAVWLWVFVGMVSLLILAGPVSLTALAEPPPLIDGFLNDPIWAMQARSWVLSSSSPTTSNASATPGASNLLIRCYLAYDDQYLYFAANVFDTNVVGVNSQRLSRVWEDDSVRLLLHVGDPAATQWSAETFSYTFSAVGGATWSRGPVSNIAGGVAGAADSTKNAQGQRYPNIEPGWPPSWNSAVSWAVALKPGTTANTGPSPNGGYSIEARIPWDELGVKPPFPPNSTMNVCIQVINQPEMQKAGSKPLCTVANIIEPVPMNPSQWERVRMDWLGPLAIRGLVEPLPLRLGSNAIEYQNFQSAETDANGPWLNRTAWTAKFEQMRSQNLNSLLLKHSSFVQADLLKPWQSQLQWILAEAKKNGINVLLFLDDSGAGTQLATSPPDAAMFKAAVSNLLNSYPDLAGIAIGAGFNRPELLLAAAEVLADKTTAAADKPKSTSAISASTSNRTLPVWNVEHAGPMLLIWTHDIEPAIARQVMDRYTNTVLLHAMQGRQWFSPIIDRHIASFNKQVEALRHAEMSRANSAATKPAAPAAPLRSIVLGSLQGANKGLFWGDPQWMRALLLDVRNQGNEGFLLEMGPGDFTLACEAFADYAYNAGQQYNPTRWETRLRELGVDAYATQLLDAVQQISAIMPKVLLLIHDESPQFMPQFGLSLVQCVNRPSYVAVDDFSDVSMRGLLLPTLGSAWRNPTWDRCVTGFNSEFNKSLPSNAVAARDLIEQIGQHVIAGKAMLTSLRHFQPTSGDQAYRLPAWLDAMELTILEGEFWQQRLTAAMAWNQYISRQSRVTDVMDPLRKSVDSFRRLAALGGQIDPQPLAMWESQMVSGPPWTPAMLRDSYMSRTARWTDWVRPLERELILTEAVINAEGIAAK